MGFIVRIWKLVQILKCNKVQKWSIIMQIMIRGHKHVMNDCPNRDVTLRAYLIQREMSSTTWRQLQITLRSMKIESKMTIYNIISWGIMCFAWKRALTQIIEPLSRITVSIITVIYNLQRARQASNVSHDHFVNICLFINGTTTFYRFRDHILGVISFSEIFI